MSDEDVVVINDEHYTDPDIAVISDTRDIVNNSQRIHTIVIDEDSPAADQNDDILEIIDIRNDNEHNYSNIFERIAQENTILSEFIEKCLDIEHTEGMLRVINRSLLRVYDSLSEDYKTSPEFIKLIHAKLKAIDLDPDHKFSHLKDMCETMKCHKKRKKVTLITLSTDTKEKRNHESILPAKRKKKAAEVMEVPIEYTPEPVIDLDEEPIDVVTLEDNQDINKENVIESNVQENNKDTYGNNRPEFTEVPVINEDFVLRNDNHLLVPKNSKVIMTEDMTISKVKSIENRIALYKKEIEKLEVLEVDIDTMNSPYVRCERFKSEVVSMYKELCSLMGAEAVKRREVRLQVTNGGSELPVKKMENLINHNIGPDGNPHFPDFSEVVECVTQANNEGNMGLSQAQITAEAMKLFSYCGTALQQNRQKRDWRNMLGRVDYKLGDDPAESDPELLAKLDENRRVGKRREDELLDIFVKMEYSGMNSVTTNNCIGGIKISEVPSDESDNDELENNAVLTVNIENDATKNTNDINTTNSLVGRVTQINDLKNLNETNTHHGEKEMNINIISIHYSKPVNILDDVHNVEVSNKPISDETISNIHSKYIEKDVIKNVNDVSSELVTRTSQTNTQNVLYETNMYQEKGEANVIFSDPDSKTETTLNDTRSELVTRISQANNQNVPRDTNIHQEKREANVIFSDPDSITDTNLNDTSSDLVTRISQTNNQNILYETNIHQEKREANVIFSDTDSKTVTKVNDTHHIDVLNVTIVTQDENLRDSMETEEEISEFATRIDNIKKEDEPLTNTHQIQDTVNNDQEILVQNIKTEPRDILKDMAQFTDNFTATIIYIEDPFLVIEISSDSSDDESDYNLKSDNVQ